MPKIRSKVYFPQPTLSIQPSPSDHSQKFVSPRSTFSDESSVALTEMERKRGENHGYTLRKRARVISSSSSSCSSERDRPTLTTRLRKGRRVSYNYDDSPFKDALEWFEGEEQDEFKDELSSSSEAGDASGRNLEKRLTRSASALAVETGIHI